MQMTTNIPGGQEISKDLRWDQQVDAAQRHKAVQRHVARFATNRHIRPSSVAHIMNEPQWEPRAPPTSTASRSKSGKSPSHAPTRLHMNPPELRTARHRHTVIYHGLPPLIIFSLGNGIVSLSSLFCCPLLTVSKLQNSRNRQSPMFRDRPG